MTKWPKLPTKGGLLPFYLTPDNIDDCNPKTLHFITKNSLPTKNISQNRCLKTT
ncbi:MAG: hypothetical protein FWD66_03285 [Paludibacter sp.]|nr:hypothetical protein [Paludibacter sp.]